MKNKILAPLFCFLPLVVACGASSADTSPTAKPTPQVIVQGTGPREEIQTFEIDNCNGKADVKRTESRSQSVEVTISAEIAAKLGASVEVISAEVQTTVGFAKTGGRGKTTSVELIAPPKTRMLFQIAWVGEERIGVVQNLRGSDIPIVFRDFTPNDWKIKSQQEIACLGQTENPPPVASQPTAIVATVVAAPGPQDDPSCKFMDELLGKSQVEQVLQGSSGPAGVQARLTQDVVVPIGWTVHNQGVTYEGPVRFKAGTFASFWGPGMCQPFEIPNR